jgi:uncharacterized membrane protein SpoIIM required for sporulation
MLFAKALRTYDFSAVFVLSQLKNCVNLWNRMRESKFIDQNAEKWKEYEQNLDAGNLGPDKMEKAFIELNDDLAYARTFYKNRSVRVFLNNLLTPVYDRVYEHRSGGWSKFAAFFTQTAPRISFSARKFMLIALVTVVLGFAIGFFGTRHNVDFARTVLGDGYVNMTEDNIQKGDPLGVYKSDSPAQMFFRIATNNLQVAFYFFLFGALFCVGTLYLLLINGIVLGVFTYLFTSRGLTTEYLLTVYQHGTLEILTMVVEGAAGIMLGSGILFPGTLTRMQSIQNAARKSIVLFMVCIPIIMVAAFIESYLTRFTEIPAGLRSMVIVLSLLFIVYYFVLMPWLKFRNNRDFDLQEEQPKPEDERTWKAGELYSLGELLIFTLAKLRSRFTIWVVSGLFLGTALFFLANWLGNGFITADIRFQLRKSIYQNQFNEINSGLAYLLASIKLASWNIYASRYLFYLREFPALLFVNWIFWISVLFMQASENFEAGKINWRKWGVWWKIPLIGLVPVCLGYLFGGAWWLLLWLIWPVLGKTMGLAFHAFQGNLFLSLLFSVRLIFQQFFRFAGAVLLVLILYAIAMFGFWFLLTVILMFSSSTHGFSGISENLLLFYVWLNFVIWPVLIYAGSYFYRLNGITLYEKLTGSHLLKRIDEIAFRKEVYGVESE